METKLKTFSEIREMKFSSADERMDYMVTEICNYRIMLQKMIIDGVDKTSKEYLNLAHDYSNLLDDWAEMYVIKFIDQKSAVYKTKQQLIKEHAQELNTIILNKYQEMIDNHLELNK